MFDLPRCEWDEFSKNRRVVENFETRRYSPFFFW